MIPYHPTSIYFSLFSYYLKENSITYQWLLQLNKALLKSQNSNIWMELTIGIGPTAVGPKNF